VSPTVRSSDVADDDAAAEAEVDVAMVLLEVDVELDDVNEETLAAPQDVSVDWNNER
jgi:hypothetical protein